MQKKVLIYTKMYMLCFGHIQKRKENIMDEEEKKCFEELINSVKGLKEFLENAPKETIEDLNFLKASIIAKKLCKNEGDTRELMKRPEFPSVPDENGDLKVEEQAFIRWCRAEYINIIDENNKNER